MSQAVGIEEREVTHAPPSLGLPNQKFGIWVFIASESMFFAALITTYMVFRYRSVVGPHPQDIINIPLVTVSTFMLLMSSLTMALAVAAANRGEAREYREVLAADDFGRLDVPWHPVLRVVPHYRGTGPDVAHEHFRKHLLHLDRLPQGARHSWDDLVGAAGHYRIPRYA